MRNQGGNNMRANFTRDEMISATVAAKNFGRVVTDLAEHKRDKTAVVKNNEISGNTGKEVLKEMFSTGKNPGDIVKEKGLAQMSDTGELEAIIEKIVSDNPKSVEDIGAGNDKAYGFLTGQVMKATKGKANAQVANEIIRAVVAKHLA